MQKKSIEDIKTIKLKVKGPISLALGEELEIEIQDRITIRELWEYLKAGYGKKAMEKGIYTALDDLPSQNLILVNGVEISALNELDTIVKPGDTVTIINYTHGG